MPGVPPSHHQPVMMQRMGGGVPPSHPSLGSTGTVYSGEVVLQYEYIVITLNVS